MMEALRSFGGEDERATDMVDKRIVLQIDDSRIKRSEILIGKDRFFEGGSVKTGSKVVEPIKTLLNT